LRMTNPRMSAENLNIQHLSLSGKVALKCNNTSAKILFTNLQNVRPKFQNTQ
jgi:hypothetical protein